jgi:hypothetical protein
MSKKKITEQFNKKDTLHPGVLETDPAKIAAADKVMAIALDPEQYDVPDELVAEAGRKALANRHIFVIVDDGNGDGGFYLTGTSIEYMKKNGGAYDERTGLINALLPADCNESCEMSWTFDNPRTVKEAARELRDAGFMWDESEQHDADDRDGTTFGKEIAEVYAEIAPKAAPAAKPASKNSHKRKPRR